MVNSVTGADVAGARVQFLPAEDGYRYEAAPDAQGRFRMEGAQEGRYIALYSARGYWRSPLPLGGPSEPEAFRSLTVADIGVHVRIGAATKGSGRI